MNGCDPLYLLLFEVLPVNCPGLLQRHLGFEGSDLLGAMVVFLDGLKLLSKVQPFKESVLLGLEDPLPHVFAKSNEKVLVLKELGHVISVLPLHIFCGGINGSPDSCTLIW